MTEPAARAEARWPRAVIFDLDGTLIDSAPDIAAAVNATLAEHGIEIDAATARHHLGDGARKLIERVLAAHQVDADHDKLDRLTAVFTERYQAVPCRDSVVFDGACDALSALQANDVKLAVCTNKPQAIADRVVAHLGLDHYIDVVVGAGAYPLKPDPAPLYVCLEALDCDADAAVYVGDMAVDRQAGHAAGLPVVLAEFGYAAGPVADLGADGVISHWRGLDAAVAALRSH
ncbi:phosphoglycolate phosphatase [Salinisphaera hydrothermalis]|uniref:phosphoglycolate phosphatase n=1 Tax=Salinisphaera hydrothermalis TaxID=563188 RepID=UPI00333E510F